VTLPEGLLVVPGAGDRRFAGLLRKTRLLALRELLARDASVLPGAMRRALPTVQAAVVASARARSTETLEAIGHPDVLPPLLAMQAGVTPAEGALRAAVPALLTRLASERGRLEESVLWDVPFDRLPIEDRGLARFAPAAQGLVAGPSGVEVRAADGSNVSLRDVASEPTLHTIDGATAHLALHDANPLAMLEDHPEKSGNAIDLGRREPSEWTRALADAIELIRITLPTLHAELALSLSRIVPVGYEPERHLSASYREAPGLVYLTLHPSVLTLAEAIVHETQHGKLNVLSFFDPALTNGRTTWTPSPVRPDLRPLSGVLLAVHAFVPVAALHLRLAELGHPIAATPELAARREQVLAGNERGLRIVRELGEPTAIGREILDALERTHAVTRAAMPSASFGADALPPG
jgi:HEXXH motif-containing protein